MLGAFQHGGEAVRHGCCGWHCVTPGILKKKHRARHLRLDRTLRLQKGCHRHQGHLHGAGRPAACAAAARRCGTGVWLAGRSWAGVAHLLAGISGAGQVQHRGGHTPVWPAAPPAPAAATTRGGPPAAVRHGCVAGRAQLGRCRTLACWHHDGMLGKCIHRGGHTPPGRCTIRHRRQARTRSSASLLTARRLRPGVWLEPGPSWAGVAHLLSGISGAGHNLLSIQGCAHPRLAAAPPAFSGGDATTRVHSAGGGEAVRHGCTVLYCVTPVCILKKKHRARHG